MTNFNPQSQSQSFGSPAAVQALPLLEIKELTLAFNSGKKQIRPVQNVSYSIFPGQTLAVVGESGCGKSVTALSILRLIPSPPSQIMAGEIRFENQNLLELSEPAMRKIRGKEIAMIFQEPMTSLNPVYTVGDQIVEAINLHQETHGNAAAIAEKALNDVGIADPQRRLRDYPHQMSGGMRQRVMIAMALSCQPKLLIADEPTTALDVTIQAQILELLRKLQQETGLAVLLITHDLGVVAENADTVAVMYASKVVEFANVEDLFDNPHHPYTQGLFRSLPKLGHETDRLETIPGNVPNPANFPSGCKFHTRCPLTCELAASAPDTDTVQVTIAGELKRIMKPCVQQEPVLKEVAAKHWAACHYAPNFANAPVTIPVSNHRRDVVAEAVLQQ